MPTVCTGGGLGDEEGIRSLVREFTCPGVHLSVISGFTCPGFTCLGVHLSGGSLVCTFRRFGVATPRAMLFC